MGIKPESGIYLFIYFVVAIRIKIIKKKQAACMELRTGEPEQTQTKKVRQYLALLETVFQKVLTYMYAIIMPCIVCEKMLFLVVCCENVFLTIL